MYWNEYKIKNDNKDTTTDFRYFIESNYVGVNMLLIYLNQGDSDK